MKQEKLNVVNPFYERVGKEYLARIEQEKLKPISEENQQKNVTPIAPSNQDDYIFVPALGFYVAKERSYLNSNFNECQNFFDAQNAKMLNLNEMREFLKYAKENNKDVYDKILGIGNSPSGEWLGARFYKKRNELYIHYSIFSPNKKINLIMEDLDKDTLINDKKISLDDWLNNSYTNQGLPSNSIKNGDFSFWYPDNGSLLFFRAGAARAGLYRTKNPFDMDPLLGVRKCFARLEDIK